MSCVACGRATSALRKFRNGQTHYLCSEGCVTDFQQSNAPREIIASWKQGPYLSTMGQQGRELHVDWQNERVNCRLIFMLTDLRQDDLSLLRRIIADIRKAEAWTPPAPGVASEELPMSLVLYPAEVENKYLSSIEALLH